jgi:hypothetical protein
MKLYIRSKCFNTFRVSLKVHDNNGHLVFFFLRVSRNFRKMVRKVINKAK